MRQLPTLIILLLVLTACTTRSRYDAMRAALDSINVLNRTDQPFTAADVQPYVDYFDRHGNSNDRLLAHYLLGRAYHEHGEAPMALQCYQQAAECADTTAADCDYAQLCRVYSQMGVLFYQQVLFEQEIEMINASVKYSLLAGDTLLAILNYEQLCGAYERKGFLDSALLTIDSVAVWYQQHNNLRDAAIAKGRAAAILVDMHRLESAKPYINVYVCHSGLFDHEGNIEAGREIFYNVRGLLCLYENKLDSAEYWFRKELSNGKDFNNQHMGAKGLSIIYENKHQCDSALKYALYAYAMNDSIFANTTVDEITRMQSMYNYTRHQEIAQKESVKAYQTSVKFWISISILLMVCMFASWLYIARKKVMEILERTVSELANLKIEQKMLEQDKLANLQRIKENQKYIQKLEKKLGRYGSIIFIGPQKAENDLKLSPNYHIIQELAVRGQKLTEKDWLIVDKIVNEYFPGCYDYIHSRISLNTLPYKICLLLRLHFLNKEISGMLGFTPAYISKLSSIIYKDLFGKEGSSKELATTLSKIF